MTSTCLRRSGFAQAGQITNKLQWEKFQFPNKSFRSFRNWSLEFVWDLGFVIWNFGRQGFSILTTSDQGETMKKKLKELETWVGSKVIGDGEVEILGVASIDEAKNG